MNTLDLFTKALKEMNDAPFETRPSNEGLDLRWKKFTDKVDAILTKNAQTIDPTFKMVKNEFEILKKTRD